MTLRSANRSIRARAGKCGFTLIELIAVLSILSILAVLITPQARGVMGRAESAHCLNNLRQIGVVVLSAAQDNGNRFPKIETSRTNPVYSGDEDAGEPMEVLGEYGLTREMMKCKTDMRRNQLFLSEGSSYYWSPVADEELVNNIVVYGRRWTRVRNPNRVQLASDFQAVHDGKMNRLYADGSVRVR